MRYRREKQNGLRKTLLGGSGLAKPEIRTSPMVSGTDQLHTGYMRNGKPENSNIRQ
jgi:hypothetical protein